MPDLEIVEVTAPHLFERVGDGEKAWPVCVGLDIESGELSTGMGYLGGARSAREVCGLVVTWKIPPMTGDYTNALLRELAEPARSVLADAEVKWNGNNHVGVYGADAQRALREIASIIEEWTGEDAPVIGSMRAEDWFNNYATALSSVNLTADSTDAEIEAAAATVAERAESGLYNSAPLMLSVADLTTYLTDAREDAREDARLDLENVRDEIERANDHLQELAERRNALIRRVRPWGRSLRDIGEMAGLSHVSVAKITADIETRTEEEE